MRKRNYDLLLTNYDFRSIILNVKRISNPTTKEENKMSNPSMEAKVKELMELKRMKEELEVEIASVEDEIKRVMGDEETLFAGAFKVYWKTFTSSRIDTTALKKALPDVAAAYTKQTTARRFSIN